MRRAPFLPVRLAATIILAAPGVSAASTFQVNPVQIEITRDAPTALLAVRNDSAEPLRFRASAFRWAQGEAGEIQLQPTEDLVFYPEFLVLQPRETRRIRIGATVEPAAVERSYRIVVEELPPETLASLPNVVRVLTRMSIPVYVEPPRPVRDARIEGAAVDRGHLLFQVRNAGTARFKLRGVRLRGTDAAGAARFDHVEPGWYVLAGGVRKYDLPLPPDDCAMARLVEIELQAEDASAKARVPVGSGACGR